MFAGELWCVGELPEVTEIRPNMGQVVHCADGYVAVRPGIGGKAPEVEGVREFTRHDEAVVWVERNPWAAKETGWVQVSASETRKELATRLQDMILDGAVWRMQAHIKVNKHQGGQVIEARDGYVSVRNGPSGLGGAGRVKHFGQYGSAVAWVNGEDRPVEVVTEGITGDVERDFRRYGVDGDIGRTVAGLELAAAVAADFERALEWEGAGESDGYVEAVMETLSVARAALNGAMASRGLVGVARLYLRDDNPTAECPWRESATVENAEVWRLRGGDGRVWVWRSYRANRREYIGSEVDTAAFVDYLQRLDDIPF